jgi:hypothetical protein
MARWLCLLLIFSFVSPAFARAETESLSVAGKRAKVVGKAALYGFGGGLVVGVASQVFKKETKNIFLFGSLGLYAGILLGVYVITSSRGPAPYEGPDTYEDYGDFSLRYRPETSGSVVARAAREKAASAELNLVNVKF